MSTVWARVSGASSSPRLRRLDEDVLHVVQAVAAHPGDKEAADAIARRSCAGTASWRWADDFATDEDYERRTAAALRPLVEIFGLQVASHPVTAPTSGTYPASALGAADAHARQVVGEWAW